MVWAWRGGLDASDGIGTLREGRRGYWLDQFLSLVSVIATHEENPGHAYHPQPAEAYPFRYIWQYRAV